MNGGWASVCRVFACAVLGAFGIPGTQVGPVAAEESAKGSAAGELTIWHGEKPLVFGFGEWEKAPSLFPVEEQGVRISAMNGRGGAGLAGLQAPTRDCGDWLPTLTLIIGPRNQAAQIISLPVLAKGNVHSVKTIRR